MNNFLMIFTLTIFTFSAYSHGGSTKRSGPLKGCHNDRKRGGFHCHSKSSFNGQKWTSEDEALNSISSKKIGPKGKAPFVLKAYNRKSFNYPTDFDHDCQNTRAEILISRSSKPVGFRRKRKCTVDTGSWRDFYFAEVMTKASQTNIDHVVPLRHAWDNGAQSWTAKKKQQFGNDPENLVVTNRVYNSKKGSKTPLEWMPSNRLYACKYMKRWMAVKIKYDLLISQKEKSFLSLLKCSP